MAAVWKTLNPAIGALLQRPLTHHIVAETKGQTLGSPLPSW